ncbi:MAG: type II and III secretion system protein family protein [Granulosicoccus sp.]
MGKYKGALRSCFAVRRAWCRATSALALGLCLIGAATAEDKHWQGAMPAAQGFSGDNRYHDEWQVVGAKPIAESPANGNADTFTGIGVNSGIRAGARSVRADNTGWYKTTSSGQLINDASVNLQPDTALSVPVSSEQPLSIPPSPSQVKPNRPGPITINLDLFVGEVKVLDNVDVRRVAVGNGSILRAEVIDTGELLIIAASAGSSSIRLWNTDGSQSDYNIRVSETDPETRVHMQRIVRMRVRMVEFRKSALGRLGIDWSDSAAGPGLAALGESVSGNLYRPDGAGFDGLSAAVAPFSTYFGVASNITSRINFLAQNGDAVTLAEPVLSAMNGGEASFLAGGEVPYPSIGENGQSQVEFKEYGVKLNVAPLIDSAGNVRTKLETEISQLDSSVSVQGTPGLLTRRAQTEVTVRDGETIVISGLLSSESSSDTDKLPGLGRLPVIGRFFRSQGKRNAISELVIFITPEVIEPGEPVISLREREYFNESNKRVETIRKQLPLME